MRVLIFLFLSLSIQSFSQTDTVYKYFDKRWEPASKEQAVFIAKIIHESKGWHRQDFWAAGNIRQMDGWYEDEATETENGSLKFYTENAILRDSNNYVHGKLVSKYIFYDNHSLKGFGIFAKDGNVTDQAGYDETGKIIPDYIFQKGATFPGGIEAWQKFLVKGLTTKQPKAYQQGKISGAVVVEFLVDKEGAVTEVVTGTSSGYEELDQHAMNVIRKSPKWNPAVQYNKKVIYRQRQSMTYAPQN